MDTTSNVRFTESRESIGGEDGGTRFLLDAVALALQTHELDQKQKRKGKDVPYIVHPLMVGLILAKAGADDSFIAAGILHDTIEDSIPEKKVTRQMIEERFGSAVAGMVDDVTEQNKQLSWRDRKLEALEHIKTMSSRSVWIKTADIISNVSDLIADYAREQDSTFERFGASKQDVVANYRAVIEALIKRWEELPTNPMISDLYVLRDGLAKIV